MMAELHIVGVIGTILHDLNNRVATIWVRVGRHEIEIKRPMNPAFEWSLSKGELVRSGDRIYITLRTAPKVDKRGGV